MIDPSYGKDPNFATSIPSSQNSNYPSSSMFPSASTSPGVNPFANPAETVSPTSNGILAPSFQQQQGNLYGLTNGYDNQKQQHQQLQQQQQKIQPHDSKMTGAMLVPAQQQQMTTPWALKNDAPPPHIVQMEKSDPFAGNYLPQQKKLGDLWNDASSITLDHPPPPQCSPPPLPPVPVSSTSSTSTDEFWNNMGFDSSIPVVAVTPANLHEDAFNKNDFDQQSLQELPPGGTYYDLRLFTPKLGIMFFKARELKDSLFVYTDQDIIDGLFDRPVAGFIAEGSSARTDGVKLGHVLVKVNGVEVKNRTQAHRLVKDGPRPLPLQFYVPDTEIVVAEGEHMVKYDSKTTDSPNSSKEWKPKYVVIGGVLAQPWMMNMYRSKVEYDRAVKDKQSKRHISVKVKRFSLKGANILHGWEDLQMVKYKNEPNAWHYFVVIPAEGKPIKISSMDPGELKGVHDGIKRALQWRQQQRLENRHQDNPPLYNYPENNNISSVPVSMYPDNNNLSAVPASLSPDNSNLPAAPVSMYPGNNNLAAVPVPMHLDNNDLLAAPVSMYPGNNNLSSVPVPMQPDNNGLLAAPVSMYPGNNNLSSVPVPMHPDNNGLLAAPVSMYPGNNNLSAVPVPMHPDNNDLLAAPVSMNPNNNNLSPYPPSPLYPDNNNILAGPPVVNNDNQNIHATFQDWNGGYHQNNEQKQQQQQQQYNGAIGY